MDRLHNVVLKMQVRATLFLVLLALGGVAPAQESASYRLREHVLNQGGHPEDGMTLSSPGYRLSLDSLGEGAVRAGLSSASYRMDGAFVAAYPPPGEVLGLEFLDKTTLTWDPEKSVGTYDVYRDTLSALSGGGYGTCWRQDLTGESTTDSDPVAAGSGFFYLVTASNRLEEEGTKGADSAGASRGGTACP